MGGPCSGKLKRSITVLGTYIANKLRRSAETTRTRINTDARFLILSLRWGEAVVIPQRAFQRAFFAATGFVFASEGFGCFGPYPFPLQLLYVPRHFSLGRSHGEPNDDETACNDDRRRMPYNNNTYVMGRGAT